MAIPFALPEDEINNLIAAVIFILSESRLHGTEENHELQECIVELVRLLKEELRRRLRSSEYDNQFRQTLLLLRQALNQYTLSSSMMPKRTSSETPFYDDAKLALDQVDATEDYSQEATREKEELFEKSLLSRLVPRVRTFWTVVPLICVVGWHLFQTNYCM